MDGDCAIELAKKGDEKQGISKSFYHEKEIFIRDQRYLSFVLK